MKHVLFLCCLLLGRVAHAQLSGTVYDAESGEPIPYASIVNKATGKGTTAKENGTFTFAAQPEGSWIHFLMVGYFPDSVQYTGPERFDARLLPDQTTGTVLVEGEQESTKLNLKDAQAFQTITEKELCKAACCNLSESFETNASIDASFTDAITGTRQIKMLGLDGRYTQLLANNLPAIRGISSLFGLGYVPGPWLQEINISKGAGSVINGFESITGVINVAHKSVKMKEKLFVNGYAGSQGRFEFNTVSNHTVNSRWSSTLQTHAATSQIRWDMNNDNFLDNPVYTNLVARNEWRYTGPKGWRGEYVAGITYVNTLSGQEQYETSSEPLTNIWGSHLHTRRFDVSAKNGYVFPKNEEKSVGSQISLSHTQHDGRYGNRFYGGEQLEARINLLYATPLGAKNKLTTGISYQHDEYQERLDSVHFNRIERVPGVFGEGVFAFADRFSVILGSRLDYHNAYGLFASPRLHARWSITELTSLKGSIGKGYRSPNILMDNVGFLASNRELIIRTSVANTPYGLPLEEATNAGLVFMHKFKWLHRDAKISVDGYYTWFQNQVVADWETLGEISFYALDGRSYSTNLQVEMEWSPLRRFSVRTAYRYLDARTDYDVGLRERPLVARHRYFVNLAYETKEKENGSKWTFDATARWMGTQRLPGDVAHLEHMSVGGQAPDFWIFHAQMAYFVSSHLEFYLGGENLGNFMQHRPILHADDPFHPLFDASLVYAPIFGRMGYIGLRWRIG